MNAQSKHPGRRFALFTTLLLALISAPLLACQVPVFRYALERWQSDQFQIVILHDGNPDADTKKRIQQLKDSDNQSVLGANLTVETMAAGDAEAPHLLREWKAHQEKNAPLLVVMYPLGARDVPDRVAWSTPLTDDAIQYLADSPVRQKISKTLVEGISAVWVFIPSGHKDQDDAALQTLTEQVKLNEEQLELPVQDEIETEDDLVQVSGLELKIDFGIVTLNRDDPKEQFLRSMLLNSESDLADLDEPMAFPVIGRGRVLYGLVGKGINSQTIGAASRFLVGPCSCQVKNQNPGFDLLLAKDWDMKLFGTKTSPASAASAAKANQKPVLLAIPSGRKK